LFQYYRDAAGVLIVYDVTNGESFSRIRRWIDEINKYCDDSIAKVLVGNKDDNPSVDGEPSEKVVSTSDAQQYAHQMNLTFFETSAKDNKNVDEAFYAITRLALHQRLQARAKAQAIQNNDTTNGGSSSHAIRLKSYGKSKKRDKKHNGACCK
jgi:GTPase SAR1 family protein